MEVKQPGPGRISSVAGTDKQSHGVGRDEAEDRQWLGSLRWPSSSKVWALSYNP